MQQPHTTVSTLRFARFDTTLLLVCGRRDPSASDWTFWSETYADDGVRRVAERAVRTSIEIASAVGGRFPKISPDPLSEREVQIARMVSSGLSDLNIAQRLDISEGTVGRHLHNIFRKLGIASRVELVDLLCMRN